jgi:hypothetical protein
MSDRDTVPTFPSSAPFRVPEFDRVAADRSVGEALRNQLADAEAQLRFEQRLARRAERRVQDLSRAVENWQDLIDEYEARTRATPYDRRN